MNQPVKAYFQTAIIDEHYYGEDIFFCKRCHEAGISLWVDPQINLIHIGRKKYDHKLVDYLS